MSSEKVHVPGNKHRSLLHHELREIRNCPVHCGVGQTEFDNSVETYQRERLRTKRQFDDGELSWIRRGNASLQLNTVRSNRNLAELDVGIQNYDGCRRGA